MSGRATTTLLCALIALIAAAVFANSLPNEYMLDDFPAVVHNRAAHWPPDPQAILTNNYWGSPANYNKLTIYRPLSTLSFALVDAAGLDGPELQRAANIAIHSACSVLVFLLGLAFLGASATRSSHRPRIPLASAVSFACAVLFAVHPVHVEAVVGVVSRAELLAAFFVLLGTLLYLQAFPQSSPELGLGGRGATPRNRPLLALLLPLVFALALLAKENGATLWGVVIAVQLSRAIQAARYPRFSGRGGWRAAVASVPPAGWLAHLWLAAVLAGYLVWRSQVLAAVLGGDLSVGDNPIVGGDLLARVMTPFKVFFEYLRLLVLPANLTIDYSLNHLKIVTSATDASALAGLALFAGATVAALAAAGKHPVLSALILAFFATYIVVSNILFLSTIIMAERLIYLPSAFFLLALGYAAVRLQEFLRASPQTARRTGLIMTACSAVAALVFVGVTASRNLDWRTPFDLYSSAVIAAPDSAKSRHLLANELYRQGHVASALSHYAAAVAIDPGNFVARTNYARALAKSARYDEALEQLKEVLTMAPAYRPAFNLVCGIFERTGKPAGARTHCFPDHPPR